MDFVVVASGLEQHMPRTTASRAITPSQFLTPSSAGRQPAPPTSHVLPVLLCTTTRTACKPVYCLPNRPYCMLYRRLVRGDRARLRGAKCGGVGVGGGGGHVMCRGGLHGGAHERVPYLWWVPRGVM